MQANQLIRLKTPGEDGFDTNVCAVARCRNPSDLIEATHKFSKFNLPLCSPCWEKASDKYDEWLEATLHDSAVSDFGKV